MLVSNLSYSQYPILKKLGSDSVVIITLKQANQVNDYYKDRENKITKLEDSLLRQKSFSELQLGYANYIQSEFYKNSQQGNESLKNYYEEREKMWEYKVHRQTRTNIYIFVAMTFLFLLK